ncbi:hypothetical protein [Yersinia rohdei]|nr:hypothetical protein [Yersinia rohdei]
MIVIIITVCISVKAYVRHSNPDEQSGSEAMPANAIIFAERCLAVWRYAL